MANTDHHGELTMMLEPDNMDIVNMELEYDAAEEREAERLSRRDQAFYNLYLAVMAHGEEE